MVGKSTQAVKKEYEALRASEMKAIANADAAYETAGMSANAYMETVTSFSASLLQSLGGDTQKAVDYADMAIRDMSDNANKMGTDMELIQNAYNGFAKGNFTMLDNLKLGYGGTKTEMERLIKDAAKLDNSINANDMSFGNIVKSINAVQREMGIYGTTAKEANQTISGSISAVKAQWENLLTAVAGDFDIGIYIENFVGTVKTAASNILPVVQQALVGVVDLIEGLLPEVVNFLPEVITQLLPSIAEAAVNIVQALVTGLSDNQEKLMGTALEVITTLLNGFLTMLPQIVQLGLELIVSLANGIAQNLPTLIPTIIDVVLQIVETLTSPDNLSMLLNAALVLITELAFGLVNNIDKVIDAIFQVIDSVVSFIINGENLGKFIGAAIQIVIAIGQGLIKAIPQLLTSATKLRISISDTFKNFDWASLGKNLVQGFKNGISRAWSNLKSWFKNLFGDLVGIAKRILGIASPSKVFRRFGIFVDEGLKGGLEFGAKDVFKTVEELSKGVTASFSPDLTADYTVRYNNNTANQNRVEALNAYNSGANKTEVVVSIDDSISPLSFARYLLPFLKVAHKEVYG